MRRDAAVGELLLEAGEQPQAGLALQPLQRSPQDMARAELPWGAFQRAKVAEKEMFPRTTLERNLHAGSGIGHQGDFAPGAEWRHLYRPERRQKYIGGCQAHAALQSRWQLRSRKALAAKVRGQVADAHESDRLALHRSNVASCL